MHFCVSSISAWQFIWRRCYIRNVLLFPTHLMCTRHFNNRKIKHLFMVLARFCEICFTLQVLLYTFKQGSYTQGELWIFMIHSTKICCTFKPKVHSWLIKYIIEQNYGYLLSTIGYDLCPHIKQSLHEIGLMHILPKLKNGIDTLENLLYYSK